MIYVELFVTFFKIGLFGFGGGAAMLSLIQYELVEHHAWLTATEFVNMVAVSQVTPGPIGINCATYAGYLATGNVGGAAVATLALVLPSFVIMMALARVMSRFGDNPWVVCIMGVLRPVVVGLIAAAALLLVNEESFGAGYADWSAWVIFLSAFVAVKWLKVGVMQMLVAVAVVGVLIY